MYTKVYELVVGFIGTVPIGYEFIYNFCTILLFGFIVYLCLIMPWKLIFGRRF